MGRPRQGLRGWAAAAGLVLLAGAVAAIVWPGLWPGVVSDQGVVFLGDSITTMAALMGTCPSRSGSGRGARRAGRWASRSWAGFCLLSS